MRIFITGGTGFIGRYVVEALKKKGHSLLVLSRKNQKNQKIEFAKGDVLSASSWKNRVRVFRPDAAIHLAWEGIPDFSYEKSAKNLAGGLSLFNVLAEIGCKKIVVAGTGFECGNRVGRIDEKITASPSTPFTAAKHSLHVMGEQLAKEKGMDFIWIRPFNPYGYGQRPGSVIPYIMRCVLDRTPLRLRNPIAQGDFIYITDLAQLISKAIVRGRGIVTYNAGSGYPTPVREIARIICEEMGATREYYEDFARTAKGKLAPAPYADLKNVRKELGWQPLTSIKKGIKETIKHHENNRNRV